MAMYAKHKETGFSAGDTVRVNYKIIEDENERIQPFEGIVIAVKGKKETKTIRLRRIASYSVGVERIIPLASPWIESIKVLKKGKVRRNKLHYLRDRKGKAATQTL